MEAAKASVKKVLGKSGQHDTTVHEKVAPAVQNETIAEDRHEREQVAVDREVHQHHHHTSEQPISHSEVLPEKHHHREIPIEHREFKHGNDEESQRRLADNAAQYQSTQRRVEGETTKSSEPVVAGEHVHHHVHETIQPVVDKQTVEPHVVHTTVPIHEVHHNADKHHATSALPGMTMDEFKNSGGALKGREERSDFFPGEPKKFDGDHHSGGMGLSGHGANPKSTDNNLGASSLGSSGHESSALRSGEGSLGDKTMRDSTHTSGNTSGHTFGTMDGGSRTGETTSSSKPSLMDKLNPKKDADGDGKAGLMK